MNEIELICSCGDPGPRPTPCPKCGGHVLFSVREGLREPSKTIDPSEEESRRARAMFDLNRPPAFELELEPFERIEIVAAEWRNAYHARKRGDAGALLRHSTRAIAHTVALAEGLR